ncbi:tetratricopeptide repeat protein 37 [Chelonus insularis]|uniref:tetratricopeptide repeat protein 37 n=1 Tax=Chelonus insularis TaxID=460826 RepID=UPI00158B6E85|nr:tetratricopeptide repeat protein 37 [Chelonus insularis]
MPSDTKQMLKEAKINLRDKQPMEAMKKCQTILKSDKQNYMALVLLGVAMKEIDDHKSRAPAAFKKAIELQPDNPLAWKGIVSYYELQSDNNEMQNELIPAYCKLLECDCEPQKFVYYIDQITKLLISSENINMLDQVIQVFSKIKSDEKRDNNDLSKINEALFTIFSNFSQAPEQYTELYEQVLSSLLDNDCPSKQIEYYKTYLKFLFLKKKFLEAIAIATEMYKKYPREIYPLEGICRIYAEQNIMCEFKFSEDFQIEGFYKVLFELNPNSYFAFFAKAVHCWKNKNFIEARDLLHQVILLHPNLFYCHAALSEINSKLYCWSQAENSAKQALKIVNKNSTDIRYKLELLLIESLVKSDNKAKWKKSVELCYQLLENNASDQLKIFLARAQVLLNDNEVISLLEELEKNPKTRLEAVEIRALHLINNGSLEEAIDVLGTALQTSEAWKLLGKIYWSMNNYSHSLMAFLKAIHANAYNWECLVYLGHYYREHGNDLEKSRKCYQKALRINPDSEEAGAGLSTAYRLLKNTEANVQMLHQITNIEGGGPKWAWLQLGLQQLDQGNMEQAIKSLRFVIRTDPNDNHCWESLGDAYWARGAHTSALKSYQRALELSPGSLYPMIQLANIQLALGRHEQAKEAFMQVLSQEQRYIPALKGLAETCLGLAKENSRNQLLGRARRHCQQAADCLTDAIIENCNLSCLWKLLGDTCYRVATLPDKYSSIKVAAGLMKIVDSKEQIEIHRNELFTLATRCYCRSLNLTTDSALLWHDLACCYYSQLHFDCSADRKVIAQKSFEAAKQAIKLCPTNWSYWNILGVICMTEEIKNYALAQHCWVMAIDRESNNAIVWTNLGTLYLYLGDPYKANEAFSRAQRFDPDYQNSWIGQALIAESVQNKEAMDLFRHATQLGYHPQAAVGYAHWVLTTVLDREAKKDPLYNYVIENMHAIPVATDAMTWFTEREPHVIFGRNALGLLLERQKLLKPAIREFKAALEFSHKQDVNSDDQIDKLKVNLARVLVQLGDYDEAVEIYENIKVPNFNTHCQRALALFKATKYEESYEAYNAALNCLEEVGSDTAHVLCAMASMAYMFQDIDDVKTLLFQCIQIQPPIVSGLLAAAALGLLHDDSNLTTLVLQELKPYKNDCNYRRHIALLSAYLHLLHEEDASSAIRVISKAIHRYPDDAGLWIGLVRILLETDSRHFGHCAQKALYLGRKNSTIAAAQVACISSLGQLIDDPQNRKGLYSVQKTIYSFPGSVESWANLIVALLSRVNSTSSINAEWVSSLISIIRNEWKKTKIMDDWLQANDEMTSKS